jgi:hypothetical protein
MHSSSSRRSDLTRNYGETHLVQLFIVFYPALVSLPHRTQEGSWYRSLVPFRARVFPVCLNLSVESVVELRSRTASNCFPP